MLYGVTRLYQNTPITSNNYERYQCLLFSCNLSLLATFDSLNILSFYLFTKLDAFFIYTDCGPELLFIFFLFLSFSHVHGQKQRPNKNKMMYQCMNKKNQTTTTTYKMQDTEEQ